MPARRWFGLTFAVVVYLASVRTLLYLIGFISDLLVWRSLDEPSPVVLAATWWQALSINIVLMMLFALPHSILAGRWGRRAFSRVPAGLTRTVYCLVAVITLDLLFWLWQPLATPLVTLEGAARQLIWIMFAAGWLLATASTISHGHFELFGLRQAWCWARGRPFVPRVVLDRGLYRVFRHPLYLGFLLGVWARPTVTAGSLLFAAGLTIYTFLGAWYEQRRLANELGEAYRSYTRRVPGLLPAAQDATGA